MRLWDQARHCLCNIEPDEKHLFLQGNAVVGSMTSLFVQHRTQ